LPVAAAPYRPTAEVLAAAAARPAAAAAAVAAGGGSSAGGGAARIAALFKYTAEDNPYGDTALTDTFTWRKKIDKEVSLGVRTRVPTKVELRAERDLLMDDIQRARKRREEREAEREEAERLRAEEARLADAAQYGDWERKEVEFHLRQTRERSLLRIRDGRERPIDSLAKNSLLAAAADRVAAGGEDDTHGNAVLALDVELADPMDVLAGVPGPDLPAVVAEVDAFVTLEGEGGRDARYWRALAEVVRDQLERYKAREARAAIAASAGAGAAAAATAGLVESQIDALLAGKSASELVTLEGEVNATIARATSGGGSSGGGVIDVEYWQRVLAQLPVAQAVVVAGEEARCVLLRRLVQLDRVRAVRDAGEAGARPPVVPRDDDVESGIALLLASLREGGVLAPAAAAADGRSATGPREAAAGGGGGGAKSGDADLELDAAGNPLPLGLGEANMAADDEVALAPLPAAGRGGRGGAGGSAAAAAAAAAGLDDAELAEKYKPRKPRYFNRVKTGYDWNRYNKSHYDHDNPPPKTVQGYKFNVFYPDLLDRTVTPTYRLLPTDSDEYALIRFSAGPPYEDIAFKIVNREWDTHPKHGFRCVFDRGVLQLHVNFKRYFYRK